MENGRVARYSKGNKIMKHIVIAAVAILVAAPAFAQERTTTTTRCIEMGDGKSCTTTSMDLSSGYVSRRISKEEQAEIDNRHAKWVAFCKPVGKIDAYGMNRLSYAHKGCEFGRIN